MLAFFFVVAEPPSIEHNYSTSDEIFFGLKKPLACGQGAGFIRKYIVYFCPISAEKNQHCIGKSDDSLFQLSGVCLCLG